MVGLSGGEKIYTMKYEVGKELLRRGGVWTGWRGRRVLVELRSDLVGELVVR